MYQIEGGASTNSLSPLALNVSAGQQKKNKKTWGGLKEKGNWDFVKSGVLRRQQWRKTGWGWSQPGKKRGKRARGTSERLFNRNWGNVLDAR